MDFMTIAIKGALKWSFASADRAEAIVPSFHSEVNVVSKSHDAAIKVVRLAAVQSVHGGDEPDQAI